MKKLITAFAIAGLVLCGGQAIAEIGTIDDVPAATLLLPYFEVDLDPDGDGVVCNHNPQDEGINTLFSVNNASAAPAIAHVTLWTDWTHETIDFDIYLTGYDVQTIGMHDVFCNATLPITAHPSADTDDLLSPSPPEGPDQATFWDDPAEGGLNTSTCDQFLPFEPGILLRGQLQQLIQTAHTGQAVPDRFGGDCWGADHDGDNVARGYITVDSVSECSIAFPNDDPDYFLPEGSGIANNRNILWGDYFYVDPENNFAQGETLVHIEACSNPSVGNGTDCPFVAGDYTFYGRWDASVAQTGVDQREPLATTYATRYLNQIGPFDGTDLVVWRDAKFGSTSSSAVTCGDTPAWFPLNETSVVAFDEEERFVELCLGENGGSVSPAPPERDPACFPLETQRVRVDGDHPIADPLGTPFPFDFGWLFLNLNHELGGDLAADNPYGEIASSWVTAVMRAEGRFSVGINAIQLDNAGDYPNFDSANTPFIADPQTGGR